MRRPDPGNLFAAQNDSRPSDARDPSVPSKSSGDAPVFMDVAGGPATVLTERSGRYLDEQAEILDRLAPRKIAERITGLVHSHDEWRRTQCLNMVAAENVMSRGARRLLDSDMATRLTEGFPGDKESPPPRQNVHIDQIEATIIALAQRFFGGKHVEWRAVSTTMVNAIAFFALTDPGDAILVQSMEGGANMNYHVKAIPRLRGLRVHDMPPLEDFAFDLDQVRAVARRVRPAMLVIGGSYVLFPYPVAELREIADEVGARLFYDAAHVGLLIAVGEFQDPLAEGANLLSLSTHKIMGGPVGGLLVTNDAAAAQKMLALTYPAFIQTRDENRYAATAYALAEMLAFGKDYARQIVANAQALAVALEQEGFDVVGKTKGYTRTHQVFLDLREFGAAKFEATCQECNILVHKAHLLGDGARGMRTGVRFTVQELTRLGMEEGEMTQVARFIRRAAAGGESSRVRAEIEELLTSFQQVRFSFDQ